MLVQAGSLLIVLLLLLSSLSLLAAFPEMMNSQLGSDMLTFLNPVHGSRCVFWDWSGKLYKLKEWQ